MAEPSRAQTASESDALLHPTAVRGAVSESDDSSSSSTDVVTSPTVRSPSSLAAPPSSFRKLRHQLMAKKFETYDNLPAEVLPQALFIGSFGAANNRAALQQCGISHIICASGSLPLQFPDAFEYLRLSIADLPSVRIAESFPAAFAFIDSALACGGRVLVHCFLGRSRSAALVLAFLIARWRMTLSEAMMLVKAVRPQAQPNSGFLAELRQLAEEQQLS